MEGGILLIEKSRYMDLTVEVVLEMENTIRNAWLNVSEDVGTEKEVAYHEALHYVRLLRLHLQDV